MNVQHNINKLLMALKLKDQEYFIDTKQFYSDKLNKLCTKYILHDGNPREEKEFFSKVSY